jgi:hypothetical protein
METVKEYGDSMGHRSEQMNLCFFHLPTYEFPLYLHQNIVDV